MSTAAACVATSATASSRNRSIASCASRGRTRPTSRWYRPSNAYLRNFYDPKDFGGYINATEWSKGALLGAPTPVKATGTADFTGTGPGVPPCSAGLVCNDADYYYWPPMWGTPGNLGCGSRQAFAAAAVGLGTITGTLSNVGIDVNRPSDIGERRVLFIEFSSSVDYDTDHYVYRYAVSNGTDLKIRFEWAAAGLSGELDAFGQMHREFNSAAAPDVAFSLPSWTLMTDSRFPLVADFSGGLELLTPVPEPGTWAQLALGLALLAWRAGAQARRRSRSPEWRIIQ